MNIKKGDLYLCYNKFKKEWEFIKDKMGAYCFDSVEELKEITKLLNIKEYEIINKPEDYTKEQLKKFKEYFDEMYGQGLEVAKWHINGDLEPFDSFYESALEYAEDEGKDEGIKIC